MLIGVPSEIKTLESRVGLVPSSVGELVEHGHELIVQTGAGQGIGIDDSDYEAVGARIVPNAAAVFEQAELIVKVKEPQPEEIAMLSRDQILFTYLHLASDPTQTELLVKSGCTAIAYETVTDVRGGLPLLSPMSEVAGRMSVQVGAYCLEKPQGGSGILLGGVAGVSPARVLVIGGGVVGLSAVRMAIGLEARVTVVDKSLARLRQLDEMFGPRLNTIYATKHSLEHYVRRADLVIGAVLLPGAAAPKLVTRDMLRTMRRGSVVVDVAIDQGGCVETARPTTHAEPTYVEEEVVHYCVTNMPGAVPRTAAFALNNATLPYTLAIANKGYRRALLEDPHLLAGLNVYQGKVTYEAVAKDLEYPYVAADVALG